MPEEGKWHLMVDIHTIFMKLHALVMTLKVFLITIFVHLLVCIYHACILVSFEYCALFKLNLMENINAQNYASVKCMYLYKKLDTLDKE